METLDLGGTGARVEVATKRHARELARCIRAQDREEILTSGNFQPETGIRLSVNRSQEAYAVYAGADLLCVFGVSVLPQFQVIWLLSSVHVEHHAKTFWRCSKRAIEQLRGRYPLMMNMIHCRYAAALRWVERLGFVLSPPEEFGPRRALFCRATLVTQGVIRV